MIWRESLEPLPLYVHHLPITAGNDGQATGQLLVLLRKSNPSNIPPPTHTHIVYLGHIEYAVGLGLS